MYIDVNAVGYLSESGFAGLWYYKMPDEFKYLVFFAVLCDVALKLTCISCLKL